VLLLVVEDGYDGYLAAVAEDRFFEIGGGRSPL
jgi:hypothetical protein